MKYLELFKNGFDETLAGKVKLENWPYVAYSLIDGFALTEIPEPEIEVPETWKIYYTSNDENIINIYLSDYSGNNYDDNFCIVSNVYENGKGIITFNGPLTLIGFLMFSYNDNLLTLNLPSSITYINSIPFGYCKNLHTVKYNGTIEQWNLIEKSRFWNYEDDLSWTKLSNITHIQCTDGQVTL